MSSKAKIIGVPWSLADIWNRQLDATPQRPLMPRNYMYASELNGAFCDRYLKMNAVPYSNPPNKRSKRKFVAGDIWELIVGLVFVCGGIFQKKQVKVDTQLKGLIPVHGRLDFIVGGKYDYENTKKITSSLIEALKLMQVELPPFFFSAAEEFIEKYKGQILQEVIYEGKSLSSFMMEKVKKTGPMEHHLLQNYHYVDGNDLGLIKGKVGYVCREDCIMEEFDVVADKSIKKLYVQDIDMMTDYYERGFSKSDPQKFLPPLEKELLFDPALFKFMKNWKIEYSPYLKYLYNYDTPKHYSQYKWMPKATSFNYAFKKFVQEGQTIEYMSKGEMKTKVVSLTPANREMRDEAIGLGFSQWDKYVKLARKAGAFQKPEEEDAE